MRKSHGLNVVVPVALKQKIEHWRRQQADEPNVSEAARQLLEAGLEHTRKSGKHGGR